MTTYLFLMFFLFYVWLFTVEPQKPAIAALPALPALPASSSKPEPEPQPERWVPALPAALPALPEPVVMPIREYQDMGVRELRALARGRIKGASRMSKAALIEALYNDEF